MLKLGFTGTSSDVTEPQRSELTKTFIQLLPFELHHGDCENADQLAHMTARRLGVRVVLHPPKIFGKRAFCDYDERRPSQPYLERNHNIVLETEALVALPRTLSEELRSGTWATVRYARKLRRPIHIIYPSGEVARERCS